MAKLLRMRLTVGDLKETEEQSIIFWLKRKDDLRGIGNFMGEK